jgi:hypothetical protein
MLCGKCRKEDRVPGQRWGASCFRLYMRDYMETRRARLKRNDNNESNAR